jgi:hypothetical protein
MSLKLQIASYPEQENIVVEIWHEDLLFGVVSHETDDFQIEIYSKSEPSPNNMWRIDLDTLMETLALAKRQYSKS